PDCAAIHFPLSAPPRTELVRKGYQTAAGFTLRERPEDDGRTVGTVEPRSPAKQAGLQSGDVIVKIHTPGRPRPLEVASYQDLFDYMRNWPRGVNELDLSVQRNGQEVHLPPFGHPTVGLHPTQVYESISMVLLFLVLMAYLPLRRHDGMVMVVFMLA